MVGHGIMETCLYVDDLEKAEAFYKKVLGLDTYARVEGRHVFFKCGKAMLLLFNPESTRTDPASGIPSHGANGEGHIAFEMGEGEVEDVRKGLQDHGVAIELEYTWPSGGVSIYFRDPAGNCLEFVTAKTWGL